ncbi:MAG TPA: hypothetical protein VGS05_04490 [Candidatus Sulfotelmatobacter sp.]|nr:hypothetical protein [Candidatus Sulfotelmatobacter sp.]
MENVSKIVRERLRAATVAADHPDADILTAFAEQSLRDTERATVLEHLARCGECRDIVALALPPIEAAEAPVTVAKRTLFAWPVLRWGFAVAGLAIIASLGIAHFQHRRSSMVAYKAAPPAVTQARNEGLPAVASPEPQTEQDKEKKITPSVSVSGKAAEEGGVSRSTPAASPVNAAPAAVGPGLDRAALPRPANQFQQQGSNRNKVPVPPSPMANQEAANQPAARIPSSAEAVEAQPSTAAANTRSQALDIQKNEGIADQSSNYGHGEEKVGRAKEPTDTTIVHMEPEKTLAASAPAANTQVVFPVATARWTITSAGGLQRSLDRGNSWQDVSVKGGPVSPAQSNFQAAPPVSLERAKDAGKKANEPIVFRAVTANGAEVWAGGSAGQLYHSVDGGYHWNKVTPSAAGAVLTGDVVSLEFVDAQHGRVSTSTSEVWVTGDDGLTWQKQ